MVRLFANNVTEEPLYVHFCIYKDMIFVNTGRKLHSEGSRVLSRFITALVPFFFLFYPLTLQTIFKTHETLDITVSSTIQDLRI